jgi:hypothetical protein
VQPGLRRGLAHRQDGLTGAAARQVIRSLHAQPIFGGGAERLGKQPGRCGGDAAFGAQQFVDLPGGQAKMQCERRLVPDGRGGGAVLTSDLLAYPGTGIGTTPRHFG